MSSAPMNLLSMVPSDAPDLPRTELRREVAELRARLKSQKEPHLVASEIARRK